jgi:hypothetical protein
MVLNILTKHGAWIWTAVGIALGLFLGRVYHLKIGRTRERIRRFLKIQLRLEAAKQDLTCAPTVSAPVFQAGLRTAIDRKGLSMRPLEAPRAIRQRHYSGKPAEETIQQTEVSCDI